VTELRALVREELLLPVDARVRAMAAAIAAEHGEASRAVVFYGSCLRQQQLDGLMLDFYLIVSDYRAAYKKRWLAAANRLIPPNVFYFEHDGLVAKYAVLSGADFERECGDRAWNVSTVARFAQPTRLVWTSDEPSADRVVDSVSRAAPTLIEWTLPVAGTVDLLELWRAAFTQTFGAELRAERTSRASALVDVDPERYQRFALAALATIAAERGVGPNLEVPFVRDQAGQRRWWRKMQRRGKWYSVARLAKASATFAGGADYIVWKINRHSGAGIELKPWQRRHPLLGALTLLPRLLRSGAVR
jgi:hypothetical protein